MPTLMPQGGLGQAWFVLEFEAAWAPATAITVISDQLMTSGVAATSVSTPAATDRLRTAAYVTSDPQRPGTQT